MASIFISLQFPPTSAAGWNELRKPPPTLLRVGLISSPPFLYQDKNVISNLIKKIAGKKREMIEK